MRTNLVLCSVFLTMFIILVAGCSSSNQEIERLKANLNLRDAEISALKSNITSLETHISNLNNEISELNRQIILMNSSRPKLIETADEAREYAIWLVESGNITGCIDSENFSVTGGGSGDWMINQCSTFQSSENNRDTVCCDFSFTKVGVVSGPIYMATN